MTKTTPAATLDQVDQLATFAHLIRTVVGSYASERASSGGGFEWTWHHREQVWVLRAESDLDPGVELQGPAGWWRMPTAVMRTAEMVITMLRLADALPAAATVYGRPTG